MFRICYSGIQFINPKFPAQQHANDSTDNSLKYLERQFQQSIFRCTVNEGLPSEYPTTMMTAPTATPIPDARRGLFSEIYANNEITTA